MAGSERHNHARRFLQKAEEYVASAKANLLAGRYTPAAGDAIHAGISAKDAIVTVLTGSTAKGQSHAAAAKELAQALGVGRGRRRQVMRCGSCWGPRLRSSTARAW